MLITLQQLKTSLRAMKEYINKVIGDSIPTDVSELTNDAGYITIEDVPEAVTIDDKLNDESTNPVQNKVVTKITDNLHKYSMVSFNTIEEQPTKLDDLFKYQYIVYDHNIFMSRYLVNQDGTSAGYCSPDFQSLVKYDSATNIWRYRVNGGPYNTLHSNLTILQDIVGYTFDVPSTSDIPTTAADVGALPDDTVIPSKVSQLTNDAGYQTQTDVSTAISTAIVKETDVDAMLDEIGIGDTPTGEINAKSLLPDDLKQALLQVALKAAYLDNQGNCYNDLYDSLYTSIDASRITATYTQSRLVSTVDDLDSLKNDLVVTYYADENDSGTVLSSSEYDLSGALTKGISTITVSYNDMSTVFNVTVHDAFLISEYGTFAKGWGAVRANGKYECTTYNKGASADIRTAPIEAGDTFSLGRYDTYKFTMVPEVYKNTYNYLVQNQTADYVFTQEVIDDTGSMVVAHLTSDEMTPEEITWINNTARIIKTSET